MHKRFLRTRALACVIVLAPAAASHAQEPVRAPDRAAASLVVEHLETDAATEPLGIDDRTPRLSWRLVSPRRGVGQSTYQVLVATRPELLRQGRTDVWDSKTTNGADPWTNYGGKTLSSRTRYYWTVRAQSANGLSSAWARPSWFEAAMLDTTDWRGRWIAGPERTVASNPAEGE